MIKCNIDSKVTEIEASGSTSDIAANIVELINNVYRHMKESNQGNADTFKNLILESTGVMFMNLKELHEELERKMRESLSDLIKAAPEEVRNTLMEMLKDAEE